MEPGSHSPSSLGSWIRPRSPTARLTGSYLPCTLLSSTLLTFSRGENFISTPTINPSYLHWPVALNAGHRDSNGTSLSSLRHVRGRDNAVADALSHVDISIDPVARMTDPPSLDLLKMAQAQAADAGVQAYRTAITQLVLADLTIPGTTTTLLCDTSTGPLFLPHGTG